MILLDTSGLLAAMFPDQRRHRETAAVMRASDGPFVLSPFVLAELDYLIGKLAGRAVAVALLDEVARGAYRLATFGPGEIALARAIIEDYRDQDVSLADASIVVLASALDAHDLLTLDERHFRVLEGPGSRPFRILPADA